MRSHDRAGAPRWLLVVLGLALVAGHGVILRYASSRLALPALVLLAVVVLVVIKHLGLGRAFHTLSRRRPRR